MRWLAGHANTSLACRPSRVFRHRTRLTPLLPQSMRTRKRAVVVVVTDYIAESVSRVAARTHTRAAAPMTRRRSEMGQTRSFGDVGAMFRFRRKRTCLWAIYEYTS